MTFAPSTVIQLESAIQLEIVVRIAKTAEAVRIPQQSVVLVRQHKGDAHLRVILEQILVSPLHVQLLALVLAEAVESLILRRVKLHLPRETVLLLLRHRIARLHAQLALRHGEVPELLAVLGFLQQLLAVGIEEGDFSISLPHHSFHAAGLHHHVRTFISYRIAPLGRCRLRHNHETLLLHGQRLLRGGPHTDDPVVHHLQPNHLRLAAIGLYRHAVAARLYFSSRERDSTQKCRKQ